MGFEPTRERKPPTRFPGVHLRPLGHLSASMAACRYSSNLYERIQLRSVNCSQTKNYTCESNPRIISNDLLGRVAEQADATASKAVGLRSVRVRFPLRPEKKKERVVPSPPSTKNPNLSTWPSRSRASPPTRLCRP